MKFCFECGKQNEDSALFCVGCGSPFTDVPSPQNGSGPQDMTEQPEPTFEDFIRPENESGDIAGTTAGYQDTGYYDSNEYSTEIPEYTYTDQPYAGPISEGPVTGMYMEPVTEEPITEAYSEPVPEVPVTEVYSDTAYSEPLNEAYSGFVPEEPVTEKYSDYTPEEPASETYSDYVPEEPATETYSDYVPEEPMTETYSDFAPGNPVAEEPITEAYMDSAYSEPVNEPYTDFVPEEPVSEKPINEAYEEPVAEGSGNETYSDFVSEESVEEEPVTESYAKSIYEEPVTGVYTEPIPGESVTETYTESVPEEPADEQYSVYASEEPATERYTDFVPEESGAEGPVTETFTKSIYEEPKTEVYTEPETETYAEPVTEAYTESVTETYAEPETETYVDNVSGEQNLGPDENVTVSLLNDNPAPTGNVKYFSNNTVSLADVGAEETLQTPQELFGDDYQYITAIGNNVGMTYKAFCKSANKEVVIKKIHSQIENLANITDTIDRMKRVKHKNLPQVIDYIQTGGNIYSVMEYIEGKSLYQLISNGEKFSEKQLSVWAEQVSSALKYLHSFTPRVIHADIKPSNIIVKADKSVVLTDYNPETVDQYGAHVIGYSDGYAPPEQYEFRSANTYSASSFDEKYASTLATGADGIYNVQTGTTCEAATRAFSSVDERSDIYNFGATFYFAVTGKRPESSTGEVTPVNKVGGKVSSSFASIISRCMKKNPKERYQTADELNAAIKKYRIKPFILLTAAVLAIVLAFLILILPKLTEDNKGKTMKDPGKVADPGNTVTEVVTDTPSGDNNTEDPDSTGAPVATEIPDVTEEPDATGTEDITTPTGSEDITDEPVTTENPELTDTPEPTEDITDAPTDTVTPEPSAEVTPDVSTTPSVTPVPTPTAGPTPTATPVPSPSQTPTPTAKPTATPTPKVESTPTPALSKSSYEENLIGFELEDGTLKNYDLSKSTSFSGLSYKNVKYVYFGGYPAARVTNESTIKNLGKQDYNKKGVTYYGGTKYMKVDYMQSSTQTATLYYRYAPIKWTVIKATKSELTLIADQVIDFYEYDGLSSWLTSTFKSAAMTGTEKGILSGDIFLLSQSDLDDYSSLNLKTGVTDYATMRKNFGVNKYDTYVVGMWWLKAASAGSKAPYVDGSGSVVASGSDITNRQGIRPVIKIKIK